MLQAKFDAITGADEVMSRVASRVMCSLSDKCFAVAECIHGGHRIGPSHRSIRQFDGKNEALSLRYSPWMEFRDEHHHEDVRQ
jgi:hypothetical protein